MSFASDVTKFGTKCGIRADKVVREVVLDLGKEIVMRTPVDTGMAKSNWFFGYDRIYATNMTSDKNGSPSISRAVEFTKILKSGTICYLTNSLPYILRLEYGSSKQEPGGMARITVARFQEVVNAAVGGLL